MGQFIFILVNYLVTMGLIYLIGYMHCQRQVGRQFRKFLDTIDPTKPDKLPQTFDVMDAWFKSYAENPNRPWVLKQADKAYDYFHRKDKPNGTA